MGDSGHLEGLRTLKSQYAYRPQSQNHQVHWEIIRPNKLRKEGSGLLTLLFDGKREGSLKGLPGRMGLSWAPAWFRRQRVSGGLT